MLARISSLTGRLRKRAREVERRVGEPGSRLTRNDVECIVRGNFNLSKARFGKSVGSLECSIGGN